VIGGGPGGYACAIKAAQLGLKTTCIEGRGTLGGTCLNVGCIPSKALLHNSHLFHSAKHDFAKRGIMIEGNVSMDLKALMSLKGQSVDGLTKGIEGLFKKNKVKYTKGWGKLSGPNTVNVKSEDGKEEIIKAKNIVIATGSDSAKIPGIDVDEIDIVTSTGALSFDSIPSSFLVVGAGVIGLELGSVWSRLGSKVTVVEFLDRILPGVDKEYASKFQKILTKQGMEFRLNEAVKSIDKKGGKLSVNIENNADKKMSTMEFDKVLVAIGRVPYTEGLGLEEMKIAMEGNNKRQIATNDKWQTNIPSIYAIGDCIKGPMLAHKAEEEGIAVAEVIAGKPGHVNYGAIPGVIYTFPEVATVGKTEEELKDEGREYKKGEFPFMANSRARTNAESDGFVKILSDKKTDRMLGVHIIGPNAGEMIAEGVIALEYGASAEDIARTCHAHPTLSEAFKEAAMNASVSDKMKCIHF